MSSYLLAFVVGEFDFVEEKDANGVLVRVYTPLGKANLGQFALDVRDILCLCVCVRERMWILILPFFSPDFR